MPSARSPNFLEAATPAWGLWLGRTVGSSVLEYALGPKLFCKAQERKDEASANGSTTFGEVLQMHNARGRGRTDSYMASYRVSERGIFEMHKLYGSSQDQRPGRTSVSNPELLESGRFQVNLWTVFSISCGQFP